MSLGKKPREEHPDVKAARNGAWKNSHKKRAKTQRTNGKRSKKNGAKGK